jgi:pyruvate-formate lyase-activating enzyme
VSGDAFCVLPWIHLEVVPEGDAKICCVAKEAIRDNGLPMNVARHSLDQIRNSDYLRSVRTALAAGKKIPVCTYCWRQESRGEGSQREIWNGMFAKTADAVKERIRSGGDAAEAMPLEYLQISVGNQCNLACRMCNASYSSRIAEDPVHSKWAPRLDHVGHQVWDGAPQAPRAGLPATPGVRPSWVDGTAWFEQPEFVEKDMMGIGSSLKMLYVTGGEPLFIPAFDRILDEYVERGYAQEMTISLNTNLFHNEGKIARALSSLLRFRHCHLAPSIDGHGAVYEYVRYPARWAIVDRNLRTVAAMAREHANLSFVLTTVAQAYNCFNLVDLLRYADELGIECRPHVLDGPTHLRPHVLPRHLRARAAEGLHAYAASPGQPGSETTNRAHALRIARYLDGIEDEADIEHQRGTFAAFTRELDDSRKQSLERSVPELSELMKAPASPRRWWQLAARSS